MRSMPVRLAVVAFGVACGEANRPPVNVPPVAALTVSPDFARPGQPVRLDASSSADEDGFVARYRFVLSDGRGEIVTSSPQVAHAFAVTGTFEIGLMVEDDRGATDRTSARVFIEPQPSPPCTAVAGCAMGERCVDGTCRPDACDADRPCPSPQACRDGACVPPPATCERDGDCGAGHACVDGHCTE